MDFSFLNQHSSTYEEEESPNSFLEDLDDEDEMDDEDTSEVDEMDELVDVTNKMKEMNDLKDVLCYQQYQFKLVVDRCIKLDDEIQELKEKNEALDRQLIMSKFEEEQSRRGDSLLTDAEVEKNKKARLHTTR